MSNISYFDEHLQQQQKKGLGWDKLDKNLWIAKNAALIELTFFCMLNLFIYRIYVRNRFNMQPIVYILSVDNRAPFLFFKHPIHKFNDDFLRKISTTTLGPLDRIRIWTWTLSWPGAEWKMHCLRASSGAGRGWTCRGPPAPGSQGGHRILG